MRPEPTIIAFDTSAAHCAAALLCGGAIVGERHEEMTRGQAERLFPLLEELLAAQDLGWGDLDALGVGIGPGNFTGIRIAVSAARGLALALDIPAIGVSSFDVMAFGNTSDPLLVTLEAPRGQVYVQPYFRGEPAGNPMLADPDAPSSEIPVSPGTQVTGAAADRLAARCGCASAPARLESIGRRVALIAERRLCSGEAHPRPSPLYVRPADAAPASDPPPVILP